MKARIPSENKLPVKVSTILKKIIADKDLAQELWEANYKDRTDETTGTTFEEWYENIKKASFINAVKEIEDANKNRRNRSERRRSERENKRHGNSRNDSKA